MLDCNLTRKSGVHQRLKRHLEELEVRQLEFVCLTHPDQDHYFGMASFLNPTYEGGKGKNGKDKMPGLAEKGIAPVAVFATSAATKSSPGTSELGRLTVNIRACPPALEEASKAGAAA